MPELNRRQFVQDPLVEWAPTVDPEKAQQARAGREAAQFADLRVEVTEESAKGIAESGYVGTQHETGGSGGFYDPGYRQEIESKGLGYEDNPVYGYLAHNPSERTDYGNAILTMKPHVKDRATLYPDDSWFAYEEYEAESANLMEEGERPPPMAPPTPLRQGLPVDSKKPWGSSEAHIHRTDDPATHGGGRAARVPVKDISRVEFDLTGSSPALGSPQFEEGVGELFQQQGIPVRYRESRPTYQPPLPYGSQELEDQGFKKTKVLEGEEGYTRKADPGDPWTGPENVGRTSRSWRHGDK